MSEEIKGRLETAIANAGRMKMPLTEALYADALALITSLTAELTAARAEVERLRKAATPFHSLIYGTFHKDPDEAEAVLIRGQGMKGTGPIGTLTVGEIRALDKVILGKPATPAEEGERG